MLGDAARKGVFVPLENVFYDLGVRGFKSDREGLNALRECLRRRSAKVVFFFATNRLFRKTYRSLQFVEEQVVELGARAVFVKSGIDTADTSRWRALLSINGAMDEFVVGMNVENIRAAHEGLLARGAVCGTVTFGYRGEPAQGETNRRGLPRLKLAVDPAAAEWVRKVFGWYVTDRLSVTGIARKLRGDPSAPPPAKVPRWTRGAVHRMLKNTRYRGRLVYGATENVWVSSKDYSRQIDRAAPLKVVEAEELRIVDDETWHRAQVLLRDEMAKCVGRKPQGETTKLTRLLNGLFVCPAHGRRLYAGGPGGGSMYCKECRLTLASERPLYSLLPRDVALRKTCDALAGLIRADAALADQIVEACRRHAERLQAPDPARRQALAGQITKLDGRVKFVLANSGDTDADRDESTRVLKQLRAERATAGAELDALVAASAREVAVPTREGVLAHLDKLAGLLAGAVTTTESAGPVRELVELLTGGTIPLYQMGERAAQRGWLQGRFPNRLLVGVAAHLTGAQLAGGDAAEVVIDYRRDPDEVPDATRAEVVALYEAGKLVKEIARAVGLNRNRVSAVLGEWFESKGEARVDGRSRRSQLDRKHLVAPQYQQVADRVHELAESGMLFGDIASELKLDRNTVTSAWKHWHASQGLPVPDGRTRRKSLDIKGKPRGSSPA